MRATRARTPRSSRSPPAPAAAPAAARGSSTASSGTGSSTSSPPKPRCARNPSAAARTLLERRLLVLIPPAPVLAPADCRLPTADYQCTPRIRCANATPSVETCASSLLLALGGRALGEELERLVQDHVDGLRRQRVEHLAEGAEPRRDLLRPVDHRARDQVRRLVGRGGREGVVDAGRRDHRRAHERHVDRRDVHAVVDDLGRDRAREGVQRALARDVGGEPRRVGLRADRRDVDDVSGLALAHARQEPEDQLQRAEVVELHRALEVVEAVVRVADRSPDRAARVVDQHVDAAVLRQAPPRPAGRSPRGRRGRPGGSPPCRRPPRSRPWSPGACPRSARRARPCRPPRRPSAPAALPMPLDAPVMTTTLPSIAPRRLRSLNRSGSRLRSQ